MANDNEYTIVITLTNVANLRNAITVFNKLVSVLAKMNLLMFDEIHLRDKSYTRIAEYRSYNEYATEVDKAEQTAQAEEHLKRVRATQMDEQRNNPETGEDNTVQ